LLPIDPVMNHREPRVPLRSQATLGVLGGLGIWLGTAVLAGWYGRYPRLAGLFPGLAPMAPRSAVSFICFGCGLLALTLNRRAICMILAGLVVVWNGLTVVVYGTSIAIDLDAIMHIPPGPLPLKAVAPNTALCFVLLGAGLFLMGCGRCFRGRPLVLALLGSTATAFSAISMIGYISGVKTFEWGRWAPMSPHTSLALASLSLGVFVFGWRDDRDVEETGPPNWLWVSVTVVATVFTISLSQALSTADAHQARRAIAADAARIGTDLATEMRLRTAVLVRAARRWEQRGKPARADWQFETSLLLSDDVLTFKAIEWVDPDLRIRLVGPWMGNERLAGADLSFEPRRRVAFESARNQRQPVLTRTVDLLTGGRGVQIYVPVFRDGVCQGFVVGIFLVDELFPRLLSTAAATGERVEISDGDEPLYTQSRGNAKRTENWSEQLTIQVEGAQWRLRVWPCPAKLADLRSSIPETVLGGGLLLSALAGTAVFLAQRAWSRTRAAETLRRAVEKEAAVRRQAEEELNQFFALSLEMLCICDLDGVVTRVNPAFERILGFAAVELVDEPLLNLVHPDDRDRTGASIEELRSGIPVASVENRYLTRDGSYRWLQWAWAPAPDRPLFYGNARDVTERKNSQEALHRVREELEERVRERTAALEQTNRALAQRKAEVLKLNQQLEKRLRELSVSNQELEAFTYSVSHDLRAPLRHIDGFSKILLDEYEAPLPEPARLLLQRVRQSTQRMGRMVDELLELSRTSRREPEKRLTGLRSVLDEVIADLSPDIGERDVEWRIAELPFADCDPALTRQVFVNLLSNALKFTRTRARAVIEVGQIQTEAGLALFVRDNGVGFSMKYADKLFGAFQRLHRQEDFEGTGVGLATVQRIVRKHGGRIWAEAALDHGATFYFTLSAPAELPGSSPARPAQRLEADRVTERN